MLEAPGSPPLGSARSHAPPLQKGCGLAGRDSIDLETCLLEILQQRKGSGQAITVSRLSSLTGANPRLIRKIISHLVTEDQIPIASSVQWPYGFYLITNAQEAEATLRQYWSRVRETAKRARALGQVVEQRFGVKLQQEFPFDESSRS